MGPLGRWFRWFVLGFAALFLATLAVWVLTGPPPGPAPVVTGPNLPDRRAPEDQSGLVPNQDQPIYESVAPGSETGRGQDLLAMPERPLDQPGVMAQAEAQDATRSGAGTGNQSMAGTAGQTTDEPTEPAAPPPTASTGTDSTPPSPSAAEGESDARDQPPTPTQPVPPRPPETAGRAVADSSPATPAASDQQYRIQIASVRTEEQAAAEWKRVADRHPDLLSRLTPSYERYETGNSGVYYRVQGGPLIDKALADLLCGQLKSRKVPCIVISP